MKIMLDCSKAKIEEYTKRHDYQFWQLRTPLTRYGLAGVPYGLDNGCFNRFEKTYWLRLLDEAGAARPVFVCLPDVVGDAQRTAELFQAFWHRTAGLPRALVLQDGISRVSIPWDDITAVFVGGSDEFKVSAEAMAAVKTAKMLDKWVHVGRVNTVERLLHWEGLANSIDGSGISRYDRMLEPVLEVIKKWP